MSLPTIFLQKHDFDHFDVILFKRLSCKVLFSAFVYLLLDYITYTENSIIVNVNVYTFFLIRWYTDIFLQYEIYLDCFSWRDMLWESFEVLLEFVAPSGVCKLWLKSFNHFSLFFSLNLHCLTARNISFCKRWLNGILIITKIPC